MSMTRDTKVSDTRVRDTDIGDSDINDAGDAGFEHDLTIDCDCCAMRHTDACEDCVVTFLLRAGARGRRGHRRRRGPGHADARSGPASYPSCASAPGPADRRRRSVEVARQVRARRAEARRCEAPPPGHERLPTQGGRDPGLPVGAVAAPRSRAVRGPHRHLAPRRAGAFDAAQAARGVRIERVPERILFFPTPTCGHRSPRAWPSVGSTWSCSTRLLPLGLPVPDSACPTGSSSTGPRSRCPDGFPVRRQALRHVLEGHAWSSRPAATRRPRRRGRAGDRLARRSSRSPRASTAERFVPLARLPRGAGRRRLGLGRATDPWW